MKNENNRATCIIDDIVQGLPEAELEKLQSLAKELVEGVRSFIEACQKAAEVFADNVIPLIEELWENLGIYITADNDPPRAMRRKRNRDRTRMIERRYRAEIRRCEKQRFCRRVYKPP